MAQESSINMKVVVLAVICVILIASTVGAFALYLPTQSEIAEKDETIAGLNAHVADLEDQVSSSVGYKSQVTNLQAQLNNLQEEWNAMNASNYRYRKIVDLNVLATLTSDSITQEPHAVTTLWSGTVDYAGYIRLETESNVTSTNAAVTCVFGDYTFTCNQTLGTEKVVVFAILPGTITVKIGNIGQAAAVNATAVYVY